MIALPVRRRLPLYSVLPLSQPSYTSHGHRLYRSGFRNLLIWTLIIQLPFRLEFRVPSLLFYQAGSLNPSCRHQRLSNNHSRIGLSHRLPPRTCASLKLLPLRSLHGAARGDGCEEEMKWVEREDSWRPGTPTRSRLYTCVSSTTSTTSKTSTYRPGTHTPAHQVRHSTPVDRYSRRLTASSRGKQPARVA